MPEMPCLLQFDIASSVAALTPCLPEKPKRLAATGYDLHFIGRDNRDRTGDLYNDIADAQW
jgi:hypothetical protein